jgi:hypothetical protein
LGIQSVCDYSGRILKEAKGLNPYLGEAPGNHPNTIRRRQTIREVAGGD